MASAITNLEKLSTATQMYVLPCKLIGRLRLRKRTCQVDAPLALGARFMHHNGLRSLLCIGLRLFDFLAKCTLAP